MIWLKKKKKIDNFVQNMNKILLLLMKKIESKMLNKRRMHIHNHKYIERIMFTHQLSHADKHSSDAHIYRKTFKKT